MTLSRHTGGPCLPGFFALPDGPDSDRMPLNYPPPDSQMFRDPGRADYKILVVDDDRATREFVSEFLSLLGFAVRTAADGAEAIAAIERDMPSLIMLDMRMPVMDGWQFAAELRRRDIAAPIVVMTAALDARERAAEIGATYFLGKPFDFDRVVDFVERLRTGWPGDARRAPEASPP